MPVDLALQLIEAGQGRVGRGLVGDPAQRGADLLDHALELGAEVDAADHQRGRLVRRVAGRLDRRTGRFLRRARRLLGGVRCLRRGLLGLLRRLLRGLLHRLLGGLVLVHAVAEERDDREHDHADQDAHGDSPLL